MNTASEIGFEIVPRAALSLTHREAMYHLLDGHFDGVTPGQFAADLAEKDIVLLLNRKDRLVGFSTLLSYSTPFEGESIQVIYSGDTLVAPDAWGSTALPRAWLAGVEALRTTLPPGRCFWMLLTSGFRTYRFLPVFWREFHPCFDSVPSPGILRLTERLASEQFGAQFDQRAGIVRFVRPQRLRLGLEKIPPGREKDPHIAYFLARNPGHPEGDELVCLTELSPENLTAAGRRMFHRHVHELASRHS
ncbi:MAG TPA: hypothetical protein VMF06_14970 [Candidatus Limnocylindria bacterium]|jgi:hypothetical protein|nr:hypothetical protein [Candidatus Limnocylindria bacterium]